ncbi:MAG: HEPN domain-containing protein [Promethearchaeota archaeon]
MSLSEWEKNGWLKLHKTSRHEIQNLLKIIERDLQDCKVPSVSPDWRFAIAYNAALHCCSVALYCRGYKPARGQSEHYRVIQSLPLTMGEQFTEIRDYLNACRAKRNISDYDAAGTISESEVIELINTAEELFEELRKWLPKNFPQYV